MLLSFCQSLTYQLCVCCAADVGETISVAGSDLGTKFNTTSFGDVEGFYSYSNTGSCVDVLAPGVGCSLCLVMQCFQQLCEAGMLLVNIDCRCKLSVHVDFAGGCVLSLRWFLPVSSLFS